MGWQHVVGSLIFLVSFAKEPYERDDILQKRLENLRSILIAATPYLDFRFSLLVQLYEETCDWNQNAVGNPDSHHCFKQDFLLQWCLLNVCAADS